jgi:hypothetical protein
MNSKLCKALRKVARNTAALTAAENNVELKFCEYLENEQGRRFSYKPAYDDEGKQLYEDDGVTPKFEQFMLNPGTMTLNPVCVKALYRDLKKKAALKRR